MIGFQKEDITFLEGLVEDFTKNSNILKVKINGTYKYTVKIELGENDEDEIIDDEYNCPYAQTGFYCKHVVAVLYEYFDKYIIKEQATEDVLFKSNLRYLHKKHFDYMISKCFNALYMPS